MSHPLTLCLIDFLLRQVTLLCKGADYIIAHRLRPQTTRRLRDKIQADINEFSRIGLRTLVRVPIYCLLVALSF